MEKMGTLKKNGDQKTNFGPHGDQSPQMGTNVGAVTVNHCVPGNLQTKGLLNCWLANGLQIVQICYKLKRK